MRKVDVIVLGSGISGCYTAALLASKGLSVCILSTKLKTETHLPESWIINSTSQLHELGLFDALLGCCRAESNSKFLSSDGKYALDFRVRKHCKELDVGDIVRVNRNTFDQVFLSKASSLSVEIEEVEAIDTCDITDSEVCVSYKASQQKKIYGQYLIDASGKTSFLSQHLSLPVEEKLLDSRYTCFSHFELEGVEMNDSSIIFLDGGYMFLIPITPNRISVGCVIEESHEISLHEHEKNLTSSIEQTPYVKQLLINSRRVLPVIPIKNIQKKCLLPSGKRYRILGEAAIFMDPFFSPGIDFAIHSAENAAASIEIDNFKSYEAFVSGWLTDNNSNVYKNIKKSHWNSIIKMFADPHLPYVTPIALTQAFLNITEQHYDFQGGITQSRGAYATQV